jgi:cytochrome b6-f complex iron-sulfur subunit
MSANKDLSVEEVLAACRRMDGGGEEAVADAAPPAETPPAETPPAETPSADAAVAKPAKPAGQMSVEEMLAAARGEKSAPAEPAKAKPTAAKATTAKASPKPAAQRKPGREPMDTTSILAAARKADRPGPMTKAEAAKLRSAPPKKMAAPAMPEKPAYAAPTALTGEGETRRGFISVFFGSFLAVGFTCMAAVSGVWGLGLARFMFPNILTEPPSNFKVGFPADFAPETVATKFKAQFGVWVVNTEFEGEHQITALKSVCTHLGCTPNWLEGEQKFKCPCHGSGFYIDGINFEGPAPRPLERYAIRVADDGQIEIDKSKKFQEEMGQWSSPNCFIKV